MREHELQPVLRAADEVESSGDGGRNHNRVDRQGSGPPVGELRLIDEHDMREERRSDQRPSEPAPRVLRDRGQPLCERFLALMEVDAEMLRCQHPEPVCGIKQAGGLRPRDGAQQHDDHPASGSRAPRAQRPRPGKPPSVDHGPGTNDH